jgi:hypothetical protein
MATQPERPPEATVRPHVALPRGREPTVEPVRKRVGPPRAAHALSLFCRRKPLGALGGFLVLVMLPDGGGGAVESPTTLRREHSRSPHEAAQRPVRMGTDNLSRDMWSA